jgi:hypothetical protein
MQDSINKFCSLISLVIVHVEMSHFLEHHPSQQPLRIPQAANRNLVHRLLPLKATIRFELGHHLCLGGTIAFNLKPSEREVLERENMAFGMITSSIR